MSTPTELLILSQLKDLSTKLYLLKQTLTLDEAAQYLDLTPGTLRKYVSLKKIGAWKPGVGKKAKLYFDKDDCERFMRRNRIKSNEEITSLASTYHQKRKLA